MDNVDVVVLGSGAAGLTAALAARDGGASVALLEKADKIGGTSAWSGGMIWIPCNDHMGEIGVEDSEDDAVEYLMSMSHGLMNEALVRTFVHTGPQMVRWLESTTPVQFQPVGHFPDYHPERPGGKPRGGRSLECPLYSFRILGEWAARVSVGEDSSLTITTMGESPLGQPTPITIPDKELERRRSNDERGCGQSLVGRLLRACVDAGVDIRTGAQAYELLQQDGRIDGVVYADHGGTQRVLRTPAVILATGGFEWNDNLVRAFLRGPMTSRVSPQTNTGDGLIMAMKAGASLANMREAWWLPVAEVPRDGAPTLNVLITCERTFPGSIMVNREAKRFTNEAANYNAFGAAFHEMDVARFDYRNLPCWLIFDQAYLDRFGLGSLVPSGGPAPDWVARERTLPALAETLGMSGDGLQRTVEYWNHQVERGRDDDFHRGESANDTWWGDPTCKGRPEATLGTLTLPPFYALEIKSGCLGTKGGPRINTDGQVLDHDGAPITGLYAAGNVMGSPMGMTYGGAGGTIAPGMVFGYRAGQHAATHVHCQSALTASARAESASH